MPGVCIAGDGAGIGGARVAGIAGRLAALKLAEEAGRLSASDRDDMATPLHAALSVERAARPFLDVAYPPYAGAIAPADTTVICRCEEVTAGDIRTYARIGCLGPNQTKAFGRAGMGPCQGRYCGLTVTALPLKPITLGELASMDGPEKDAAG